MYVYDCGTFRTACCELGDSFDPGTAEQYDYVMLRINVREPEKTRNLIHHGFSFHDRYLKMEINIEKTSEVRESLAKKTPPFFLSASHDFEPVMLDMACQAYAFDRRYHLGAGYDNDMAREMIRAHLSRYKEEGCLIVKIYDNQKNELLGYTVLKKKSDFVVENVMGLTLPGIKGKVSAFGLYNGMLNTIAEMVGKKGIYMGYVSSENITSINLHNGLGARVSGIEDEYIYRRNEMIPAAQGREKV